MYPEFTGSDLKFWKWFLPRHVLREDYTYDEVPEVALRAVQEADSRGIFTRIEVWSPQGNTLASIFGLMVNAGREWLDRISRNLDPIAMGVVIDDHGAEHFFPIARWGESELLSFDQVKAHVNAVNWQANLLFLVLPILMVVATIAGFDTLMDAYGFWLPLGGGLLTVVLAAVVINVYRKVRISMR